MRRVLAVCLLAAGPASAQDLAAYGPDLAGWTTEGSAAWLVARPAPQPGLESFGTAMKYALPAAAAICAARQHRLEDFAARGLLQMGVVWGLKQMLGDTALGRRPNGAGEGFPSGHTSSAFFGAADLAGKCSDEPAVGAAAYGAAGLTGLSRVQAGEHTPAQALSGAVIGLGFGGASFGIGGEAAGFSLGMRF